VVQAMRLNPQQQADYAWALGHAYYVMGRYEAIAAFKRALIRYPNFMPTYAYLAAIYSELDREEEARSRRRSTAHAIVVPDPVGPPSHAHLSLRWRDATGHAGGRWLAHDPAAAGRCHQATPHDTHDWDLTQASPLFTAEVKGQSRRLVAVTGKDGLLRVLDRETREPIYEVAVTRRENITAPVTIEGVHTCPGPLGGVQWNGPAFSPRTNMLYVPAVDWCGTYKKAEELRHVKGRLYMGGSFVPDPVDQMRGWLTAIDALSRTAQWRYQSSRPMVAAVTATSADLVFTGELNGDVIVLDGRDGSVLYRSKTGGAISGGIVTYQVGGKQYVAVTSGAATRFWRVPPASATVVVFSLPTIEN
jgi:glucose dehydrogenase